MSEEYRDALKKAQKEFRACIYQGKFPYLPRLDEFVPADQFSRAVDLGTVQVPLELVAGTRTGGRTRAFARNFMPLLGENTEFAAKWERLCKAHVDEGIRDPIKAVEYMNRFYVEEGNKRVSVLKYFGAVSVAANVTRILPQRNGSREVELYYEFVDFYRCAQINFLEFSRPGSYQQLQKLLGKAPEEPWSLEEQNALTSVYYYFRKAYESAGGKRLASTVADALLAFLRVYGWQGVREMDAAKMKKSMEKVWEEITLQQEPEQIDVKLAPADTGRGATLTEKGGNLISRVLTLPKVTKAAFIHDKDPRFSGWLYAHEVGRQYVDRAFHGDVQTSVYYNEAGDPRGVIEAAIEDGNTVLFTTSPRLLNVSLRAAVEHPEVTIFNCSLNASHRYIRTYYARMYEVKFITGAIAGSLAGTSPVGYICDYPIFGQVAGINAFALGVQMTNPTARVHLEWSSSAEGGGGVDAAARRLGEKGVRLISSLDLSKPGQPERIGLGLTMAGDDGQVLLASPQWKWGVYYEELIQRIRDGSLLSEYRESSRALNYYWGLSAGVVDLLCTDKLPDATKRLAHLLRESICSGFCDPFRGPLYNQNGHKMEAAHESFGPEQIMAMDWLNENIVGKIPAYHELNEGGKAAAEVSGVGPAKGGDTAPLSSRGGAASVPVRDGGAVSGTSAAGSGNPALSKDAAGKGTVS